RLLWREHVLNPQSPYSFWGLWELYSRAPWLATIRAHDAFVWVMRFTADSRWLLTGSSTGQIRAWDTATLTCRATLDEHQGKVLAIEADPYGRGFASLGVDHRLVFWDLPACRMRYARDAECGDGGALAMSPDGRWLATAGVDQPSIRIWDAQSG